MKSLIFTLTILSTILLGACTCSTRTCSGIEPIDVVFEGYDQNDQMGMLLMRYEKGGGFSKKISEGNVDLFYTDQLGELFTHGQIWLYGEDVPENFDYKLLLIADSSEVKITNLERQMVSRKDCSFGPSNKDLTIQNCIIKSIKIESDHATLQDDGSLLWKK